MTIAVIICTSGRPSVLRDTVLSLLSQTQTINQILIGAPDHHSVLEETRKVPQVQVVYSSVGSAIQRNACMDRLKTPVDLVSFVDDDMEFSVRYFAHIAACFIHTQDLVSASGHLLHDGGIDKPVNRAAALHLVSRADAASILKTELLEPRKHAYGCNMTFRYSAVAGLRFDEELPLYAWLEDSDFSQRAVFACRGPVTCLQARAVHLGWPGGRMPGVSLGFSQVVNPLYLWTKSRPFTLRHIIVHFWMRCLLGNLVGSLRSPTNEDRRGRLRGNVLGYLHLLQGRCQPGLATQLAAGANSERGSR